VAPNTSLINGSVWFNAGEAAVEVLDEVLGVRGNGLGGG
jgi:hypothetical protein